MPRLPDLDPERLTPEQAALHEAIASGPRGADIALQGPFRVWMHNPQFGQQAQRFGRDLRYGGALPPRVFELAVLVCAAHWQAPFEWQVHGPLAIAAGVPEPDVLALTRGESPGFSDPRDRLVHNFCSRLLSNGRVPDDVFERVRDLLGLPQTIELVGVVGYYSLVALTLNVFEG